MKNLLYFITFLLTTNSFAGTGHGHTHGPVDLCKKLATKNIKISSIAIGKCHISRLVKAGKIDVSWKNAKHIQSVTKKFRGRDEWLISFNNEKGKKGKKLFIFLNLKGGFVAANFTGK